jgi:hypothetical protein
LEPEFRKVHSEWQRLLLQVALGVGHHLGMEQHLAKHTENRDENN